MKKVIIYLFALFLTVNPESQIKPQYGFKLGVNVPNISVRSDKRISVNTGNVYGAEVYVFLELPLTKLAGVSSELGYEQIMTEADVTFYSGNVPYYTEGFKTRCDYLSYLLKGKLNVWFGDLNPYFTLGGKLSIFLDDKFLGSSSGIEETIKIKVNENYRTLCFYPVIGAGCEFKISPSAVFLTEFNFAFPVESFFEYEQYGVSAKPYVTDLKIGLKF